MFYKINLVSQPKPIRPKQNITFIFWQSIIWKLIIE